MSFYALWPAWKLLGSTSWGMQVGALLLNGIAAGGAVLVARRRGGLRLAIGVTAVCPGLINTPITQTSRMRGPDATAEARAYMVDVYRRRNYTPERVAENVLKAIQRNRAVAPISPEAWVMYLLKRLAPGLVARVNRAMAEGTRREVERRRTRPS